MDQNFLDHDILRPFILDKNFVDKKKVRPKIFMDQENFLDQIFLFGIYQDTNT